MAIPYVVSGADYWQQRALREDAMMDQLATQAEQNLVSVMNDLNDGMQSAVDRFIVQYLSGKPEVAYSDLAQTLQPAELKRYRAAVNRLKINGVPQTKAAAKLANASKKVSRIDALTNELSQWLNNGAAGIQRVMDPQLQATYDVEKTLRAGAMKGAGIGVSFAKNSPYQLRSVMNQRWLGSSYSDRVWKQKDALLAQLAKSLPQMFIAGADNNAIAKELQRVTGVNQSAANRLIRTEGAKVATQADLDLYKDAGLDTYVYMATLDGRTSEICRQMNGKKLDVSKLESGVTAPPLHPNCRSTTVPDVDTSDIDEVSVLESEEAVANKYGGIARPRNAQGVIVVDSPDVITKRLATAKAQKQRKTESPKSLELTPTHHWANVKDGEGLLIDEMYLHVPDMTDTPTQQFKKLHRFPDEETPAVIRADGTKANPRFLEQRGYRINCQTCVVAYEARLRGYDVEAKAYRNTGIQYEMSTLSKYNGGVIAQFGPKAIATPIKIDPSDSAATDRLLRSYVPKVDSRFVMEVGWNDAHGRLVSGHIVNVEAMPVGDGSNFELVVIDAQSGRVGALSYWIDEHRSRLNENIALARVDNQPINPEVITTLKNS
jgi:SPP1 gp7 family putative phage head morphogenesis protein